MSETDERGTNQLVECWVQLEDPFKSNGKIRDLYWRSWL